MELSSELARLKVIRAEESAIFSRVNTIQEDQKRKIESKKRKKASGGDGDDEEEDFVDDEVFEQLLAGYKEAFVAAGEELECLDRALVKLKSFMDVKATRDVKRPRETPPPVREEQHGRHGDVWAHSYRVLPKGYRVAANTDSNAVIKMWILALVDTYQATGTRERYAVQDAEREADDKDGSKVEKKLYWLDASKIVALPTLEEAPLTKRRIMNVGERVMAMFPDTSCFYAANVLAQPRGKMQDYKLMFDDDDNLERSVNAEFVFPFPEGYTEQ